MIRRCALCSSTLQILAQDQWHIPGLGKKIIGFSHCPDCGMIQQSPTVTPDEMTHFYKTTAVYNCFSDNYKPTEEKIISVTRNINDLLGLAGNVPKTVFQVGCSDGYTLSRYQEAGADSVLGIDPSEFNRKIAKIFYNIDSVCMEFEEFETDQRYDLAILTHVLEHLYDPKLILTKCNEFLHPGGWLLAEVPLLEKEEYFPTGYLSFEHINYFTADLFTQMIEACGFEIQLQTKLYKACRYPVVTVIAKKFKSPNFQYKYRQDRNSAGVINRFLNFDKSEWLRINNHLLKNIKIGSDIFLWGAGIHTSQLLCNTDIKKNYNIRYMLDNSETKWGKEIANIECRKPSLNIFKNGDIVVISTRASEEEVYQALYNQYGDTIELIKLYNL
ncbi:class I SAM-dependent methyltransferase [Desulfuromonas sp. CSMB_57]|uniref:class I SAM-dependent methyltransferase n=1 Tax=Desulfuromonas sp. CSMB_57 TaxID=2807629 RepID=UPI001CD2BD43|nr:class I SAM-dependent methyltransferase [Desulfuromonas sp. CSMB_57]